MSKKKIIRLGLVILILSLMTLGYGGWCRKDDDDDVVVGSSGGTGNGGTPSPTASAIAAGRVHSLTLLSDGTIRAWGNNGAGQLGDGTKTERHTPVPVSGITDATAIECGDFHSAALLSDGTIRAWGGNDYGQLGDGTTDDSSTSVSVSGITTATAIACGGKHTVALLQDDTIQSWGENDVGQLGNGTTAISSTIPVPVSGITTATAIACGGVYTVALLQDGTIQSWGFNDSGQLGNGTVISSTTPVPVSSITTATAVAAGWKHTMALLSDGTIMTWGDNTYGQLGNGSAVISSTTPVPVSSITTATAIACGRYHSMALLSDGTLQTWGANGNVQLGHGTTVLSSTVPAPVSGITTAIGIAGGGWHTMALLSDKTIQTWGLNGWGQLGDGSTICSSLPIWVSGFNGSNDMNRSPMLNAIGPRTVDQSQLLSFTISAIDPNEDTLTYSGSGLPSGATFDPATKTFNWTPGSTDSYPGIKFTVTDPGGLSDQETIEITVVASSPPYEVTFLVLDLLTGEHLTGLEVDWEFPGVPETGLDSPVTHTYSAGNYTTMFDRINYAVKAEVGWDADGHKTFIIYMEKAVH